MVPLCDTWIFDVRDGFGGKGAHVEDREITHFLRCIPVSGATEAIEDIPKDESGDDTADNDSFYETAGGCIGKATASKNEKHPNERKAIESTEGIFCECEHWPPGIQADPERSPVALEIEPGSEESDECGNDDVIGTCALGHWVEQEAKKEEEKMQESEDGIERTDKFLNRRVLSGDDVANGQR